MRMTKVLVTKKYYNKKNHHLIDDSFEQEKKKWIKSCIRLWAINIRDVVFTQNSFTARSFPLKIKIN